MKQFLLFLGIIWTTSIAFAQVSKQADASEIYSALLKLQNTSTAMYVAAHPDDENTRLISWLSNHEHANTVYLSLTRGDGGQNLIGTEKGPLLGLLRTQELLQARSVDGGHQFFTRANDFGYSKTATETRAIWEEEKIMRDVVWAIRKWQPDILVNRFDHTSNGRTHGHHTFSAIASMEAFDMAGDPNVFPDQLQYVDVWQPTRLFFNTSWWFYGSRENFENADKSDMMAVDVGVYYPILGKSNNEIAAESRSMHKCQGFGSSASRGSQLEYLQFLKGDAPTPTNGEIGNIFEGINTKWSKFEGGDLIDKKLEEIIQNYDIAKPDKSIPELLNLRSMIYQVTEDDMFGHRKRKEIDDIIVWSAGLYMEAVAANNIGTPGDSVKVNIECVKRSDFDIKLLSISSILAGTDTLNTALENNSNITHNLKIAIPAQANYSTPYWLRQTQFNTGMYEVPNPEIIGQPENTDKYYVDLVFEIGNQKITVEEPLQYKWVDPAVGEIYEPFIVAPPASVSLPEPVYILSNGQSTNVKVNVRSHKDNVTGTVKLNIKEGWKIHPESFDFSISQSGDKRSFSFVIHPPDYQEVANLTAELNIDGRVYDLAVKEVDYDHIPKQTLFLPSQSVVEHLKIDFPNMRVGYIQGAGDEIPQSLRQLGIVVEELDAENLDLNKLKQYSCIVLGIRAFNTKSELAYLTDDLWKYVEEGGKLITQYNTSRRLDMEIAPFPLILSRNRITEENASLKMLVPDHPVFNFPNKITNEDFDDWVQERGLYFAGEWGEEFVPLLSGHDTGEDEQQGALLVAEHGKGFYIYTGLSFFRQLPAGVPGAYKLFVNLLALQKQKP